ncbi:MAG: hypothetical protein E6Q97_07800 [Desulfurellales bacterium]|nr:MAG: hypothetical protein E6Q97_07800 [Desulfurellales bacterium]
MAVEIKLVDNTTAFELIRLGQDPLATAALSQTLALTTDQWFGFVNGECVCAWGVVPPTILSDQAYLWMHATDAIRGNEFIFVRHSQRIIAELLKSYTLITGFADPLTPNTLRWLKFLGAEFEKPKTKYIPFTIRRKDG